MHLLDERVRLRVALDESLVAEHRADERVERAVLGLVVRGERVDDLADQRRVAGLVEPRRRAR